MARIGPIKKVFSVPEPVEAPAFGKPKPLTEPEQEPVLVPVRRQPQRVGA